MLTPIEVDGLLATLRRLAADGTTIVLVTHKLDEVRAVADDVTVLRAGKTVATFAATPGAAGRDRLDVAAIARAMVGADLPPPPAAAALAGDARDRAGAHRGPGRRRARRHRSRGSAPARLSGSPGSTATASASSRSRSPGWSAPRRRDPDRPGATPAARSPAQRLALGLAHIPEDRQHGGLWLDATIADNLALGRADVTGRFRIDRARVAAHAARQIAELDIRPADPGAVVRALSGGNQQKVVIGRELSRPDLSCVLAAQPTRGVDLGAVVRIHDRLRAAAAARRRACS